VRSSTRRRLAVGLTAPWALAAALRATGTERGYPLVPALAFTPQIAATAVLPVVAGAVLRSRGATVLAAASAATLAAAVLPRTRRSAPTAAAVDTGGRTHLRLGTANLLFSRGDAGTLVDLVRRFDLDVLALQEVQEELLPKLASVGLPDLLPEHHVLLARPDRNPGEGGAVFTRLPVTGRSTVPGHFEQPRVRVRAGGWDVDVTAVHLIPPALPSWVAKWQQDLADLPDPDARVLQVLAGDYNATADHAAFRARLRRGYRDAARLVGRGLRSTWTPQRWPDRLPGRPGLALDHVLLDPRLEVAHLSVHRLPGSDHRAVVVDLLLPPPA
jgi:endonuclease/exonuclease/phosphatase family metal-dependent hydrolase